MLGDRQFFGYRDLQKLCAKLHLGGKGSRDELEMKLLNWHRSRTNLDTAVISLSNDEDELLPMNVIGNNFALFEVDVQSTPKSAKSTRRSSMNLTENVVYVSPSILRPLRSTVEDCVSPPRSALKRKSIVDMDDDFVQEDSAKKIKEIKFSPFNGVRIIPNRITYAYW